MFTKCRRVQSMWEEGKLQGCGTGVQTSPEAQGRGQAVTGDQWKRTGLWPSTWNPATAA